MIREHIRESLDDINDAMLYLIHASETHARPAADVGVTLCLRAWSLIHRLRQ